MAKNANDTQEVDWYKQHLEKLKNIKQKTVAKSVPSQEGLKSTGSEEKLNESKSPLKRKADHGTSTSSSVSKVKSKPDVEQSDRMHPPLMSLCGDSPPVRPGLFGSRFNRPPPMMRPGSFFQGHPMGQRSFPMPHRPPNMHPGFIKGLPFPVPIHPIPRSTFWPRPEKKARPALEKRNVDNKKENISKKNEAKDTTFSQSSDKKISDSKATAVLPSHKEKDSSIEREKEKKLNKASTSMKNDLKYSESSEDRKKPVTITRMNSTATSKSVVSKSKNITSQDYKASASPSMSGKTAPVATMKQSIGNSSPSAKPAVEKDATKLKTVVNENLKQPQTSEGVVKLTPNIQQGFPQKKNDAKQGAMTVTISKNAVKPADPVKTFENAKIETKTAGSSKLSLTGNKTGISLKSHSPAKNSEHSQAYFEHLQKLKGKTKTVISNTNLPSFENKNMIKKDNPNTNLSKPLPETKNFVEVEYPHQKPMQSKCQSSFQGKQLNLAEELKKVMQPLQRYQKRSNDLSGIKIEPKTEVDHQITTAKSRALKSKTEINWQFDTKQKALELETKANLHFDVKPQPYRTGQPQRNFDKFEVSKDMTKKALPKQSNIVLYPNATSTGSSSNRIINRQNVFLTRNQKQTSSCENETKKQFPHVPASQQRQYSFEKEGDTADLPISDEEDQFVTLDSTYTDEDREYNHYQRRYRAADFFNKERQISMVTSNVATQSSGTMETTRSGNNMAQSYVSNNMTSRRINVKPYQSSDCANNPRGILKHKPDERKRNISPSVEDYSQYERPNKVKRNIAGKRLKPDIPYRERNTMEVVPSTEHGQDMIAEMSIDNAMAAGLEFIHPISGYHCLLCQSFYPDYPTALHHCTLLTHKMKVLKEQTTEHRSFSGEVIEQNQQIQTILKRGAMRQTQLNEIAKHYS